MFIKALCLFLWWENVGIKAEQKKNKNTEIKIKNKRKICKQEKTSSLNFKHFENFVVVAI